MTIRHTTADIQWCMARLFTSRMFKVFWTIVGGVTSPSFGRAAPDTIMQEACKAFNQAIRLQQRNRKILKTDYNFRIPKGCRCCYKGPSLAAHATQEVKGQGCLVCLEASASDEKGTRLTRGSSREESRRTVCELRSCAVRSRALLPSVECGEFISLVV
eukprot:scaffold542490_cov30-Prasinocladus_malaysianus.AAC.2